MEVFPEPGPLDVHDPYPVEIPDKSTGADLGNVASGMHGRK